MTRGQICNKIRAAGYTLATLEVRGISYMAEMGNLKLVAKTPMSLWKQIKTLLPCGDFEICSLNSDASCFSTDAKSITLVQGNPQICNNCIYNKHTTPTPAKC